MKAKHKSLKQVRLTDPTRVCDVQLGHHATADRPTRNRSKADVAQRHDSDFDDVKAREKRYGISW